MDNLFLILFLISLVGLIVGLIKPSLLSRFLKEKATRKNSVIILGIATLIFFILFGITTEPTETTNKQSTSVNQQWEQNQNKVVKNDTVDILSYSTLQIVEINPVDNKEILISGETDLPNGAVISVGFDVWGRAGSDLYIGVSEKQTVANGKFSATLSIPQREEFKTGPYEISVLFTPRGQSDAIVKLVGENGENLTGNLVQKSSFEFNTMEIIEKKDINLFITPPTYTFQSPNEFSNGTPERVLAEYILAWKNQNWNEMVNFSQKTWKDKESDPTGLLEAWYDFKTLKGFEIKNVKKISDVTSDITFIVNYEAFTNQISKKQITARIIKETAPYTPSVDGKWGVNPVSMLREDDIK